MSILYNRPIPDTQDIARIFRLTSPVTAGFIVGAYRVSEPVLEREIGVSRHGDLRMVPSTLYVYGTTENGQTIRSLDPRELDLLKQATSDDVLYLDDVTRS